MGGLTEVGHELPLKNEPLRVVSPQLSIGRKPNVAVVTSVVELQTDEVGPTNMLCSTELNGSLMTSVTKTL